MYDKDLSILITDARELLGRLKNQYELNERQIQQNTEMLQEQNKIVDKKIAAIEKSWGVFRNILITFSALVLLPLIIGGFTMKADVSHIKQNMENRDCVTETEVLMSFGIVIDHQTDALESLGVSPEEADRVNEKMRDGVSQAFGYKREKQ